MYRRPNDINDCIYNLADIIKYNYCACRDVWSEESIARMYLDRTHLPAAREHWQVDFRCLSNIVKEKTKDNEEVPDDVLSIHVRLGDLLCRQLIHTVPDVKQYENLIKRAVVEYGIVRCDIYYGNHRKQFENESQKYIQELIKIIKKLGLEHKFISRSVDDDFCSLATSKHYLPSIRGFSWLTASINPNNVIWDIATDKNFSWDIILKTGRVVTEDVGRYRRGLVYQNEIKINK